MRTDRKTSPIIENLEGRNLLSYVLPHHTATIHTDGFQPAAAKPPAVNRPGLQPPWIDNGMILRVVVGGAPHIPGGPLPIIGRPIPVAPGRPAPAPLPRVAP